MTPVLAATALANPGFLVFGLLIGILFGTGGGIAIGWGLGVRSAIVYLREELEPDMVVPGFEEFPEPDPASQPPSVLDSYHREIEGWK